MTRKTFRENLFYSHLADLRSIFPDVVDICVCPICLREFSLEDLCGGRLTDGHVWTKDFRDQSGSKLASMQRVLLCKACNDKAGSRGDKQSQVLEKVKRGDKIGKFYGVRRVQIFREFENPIELNVAFVETEKLKGNLNIDRRRNNPKELEKFEALGTNKPFSMIMHPYHKLKPKLGRVGLITSAYLLAFYTFGYRYILQENLNAVRECILTSFEVASEDELKFPDSDIVSVKVDDTNYRSDPEIGVVIPTDGETAAYLQISFFDWLIKLPFEVATIVFQAMIELNLPQVEQQRELSEREGEYRVLYVPISCNKMERHDCVWDYILGKPIPNT